MSKQQEDLATLLESVFGLDVWDDGSEETARRVLQYWSENIPQTELSFRFTTFDAVVNQMVVVTNIEFSSLCSHHLLPFYGVAHVGYIPNKLMVGVSKIPRLVDFWARRPGTQEMLTANVAKDLKDRLQAMGVAVLVEARHTCMACRGVLKHNGVMVTSEMRGVFLTGQLPKEEFLAIVQREKI